MVGATLAGIVFRSVEPDDGGAALRREQVDTPVGQGLVPALLGGLRPMVAAGCWLRANLAWEVRDEAATIAWIDATIATDGRVAAYWLNGARMIAYDLPAWSAPHDRAHTQACAERALRLLEWGLLVRGADAALWMEMANIQLRVRGDREAAARLYRQAALVPGAPYHAARIHGELLVALGRPGEALAWFRAVRVTLPADDPAARIEVVEARIRQLAAMSP